MVTVRILARLHNPRMNPQLNGTINLLDIEILDDGVGDDNE
jgi:hypothetical protein